MSDQDMLSQQDTSAEGKKDRRLSAGDVAALQEQLRKSNELLQQLSQRNAVLEKEMNGNLLPQEEQPIYELTQPFMSPDDVYYPEGVQIVDVTGEIIPNEFMIPCNQPAQVRYDRYMKSLPVAGRQPTISEIIDVAARVHRELGPNASGDQVSTALLAALVGSRVAGAERRQPQMNEPANPRLRSSAPLMANTHIVDTGGIPSKVGLPQGQRGPARTRQVGVAPAAAADLTSGVRTPPLEHQPV